MLIPSIDDIISNKGGFFRNFRSFKIHYFDFYKYLYEKYKDVNWKKFTELLYLYVNNLDKPPVCKICGNPVSFVNFNHGYKSYCSIQCAGKDSDLKEKIKQINIQKYGCACSLQNKDVQEKTKQTCLKKYGAENYSKTKEYKEKVKQTNLQKFGTNYYTQTEEYKNRVKQTCLEKYGVENVFASDGIKNKIKQTCLDRYGAENYSKTKECKEKVKQTCLKKYGVDSYFKTKELKQLIGEKQSEIIEKSYYTKQQNHTFKSSSIEKEFKKWLDDNNIEYKYQYKSKDYPFNCDFYFPDKDLYLEIQGSWTHGFHPFDNTNPNDVELLNKWKLKNNKFYNKAIETWTIRDVDKRNWAKEHNLNWIEIFTIRLDDLTTMFIEPSSPVV